MTQRPEAKRLVQFDINTRIRENAEDLAAALDSHMLKVFAPDARKELRRFTAGDGIAKLLTRSDQAMPVS